MSAARTKIYLREKIIIVRRKPPDEQLIQANMNGKLQVQVNCSLNFRKEDFGSSFEGK